MHIFNEFINYILPINTIINAPNPKDISNSILEKIIIYFCFLIKPITKENNEKRNIKIIIIEMGIIYLLDLILS
ncbi:hypothetical protein AN960_20760 [Bacillus sp. FJAT-25509]|nr:hypothetical protein AN960_20760 [Bacillus sp. FJAT-25509]